MLSTCRVVVSCVFVLMIAIESAYARSPQDGPLEPCQMGLPANITVTDSLEPLVVALLRGSETFRRQCDAIARRPDVRVFVRLTAGTTTWMSRASATIWRFEAGALRAVIDLPVSRDAAELIGHEFEHVLEQVDGVNLRLLASDGSGEAHRTDGDAFETRRALLAGQMVAGEAQAYIASRRRHEEAMAGPAVGSWSVPFRPAAR
jgi:ketosteroid isomerase-like protein